MAQNQDEQQYLKYGFSKTATSPYTCRTLGENGLKGGMQGISYLDITQGLESNEWMDDQ